MMVVYDCIKRKRKEEKRRKMEENIQLAKTCRHFIDWKELICVNCKLSLAFIVYCGGEDGQ